MNLKHLVRDAAYLCLGTAAVIVEKGGDVVQALVRKGSDTWNDNQDTVDGLKKRAKELCDKAKDKMSPAMDAAQMSPEERAELRRQLDEADAAGQGVEPDDITRTDDPVPDCGDDACPCQQDGEGAETCEEHGSCGCEACECKPSEAQNVNATYRAAEDDAP